MNLITNIMKKGLIKGVISLISLMVLMVMLLLGAYFLTFVLTEARISKSQILSSQTHYLAEAGINQAIWKLKNEEPYRTSFITQPICQRWSTNFAGGANLIPNGSYVVSIENLECARAQITSTATIRLSGEQEVKRVIKVTAFKAVSGPIQDSAVFSGGTSENIEIYGSNVKINDGNLYANNNLLIKYSSHAEIVDNSKTPGLEGQAVAVGNMDVSADSSLISSTRCDKAECVGNCLVCPPVSLSMPMVNFDSYKTDALTAQNSGQCQILCNGVACSNSCILSSSGLDNLLWQVGIGGELTLNNNITYITGSIELKGGRKLSIKGVLVADGTIDIGTKQCWTNNGQKDCGFDGLNICDFVELLVGQQPPTFCQLMGRKGGLLSKAKINFGAYASSQDIKIGGLIYGEEQFTITDFPYNFIVKGGILARKMQILNTTGLLHIYLDNSLISQGLGVTNPLYSPVIVVERWEEVY